MITVSWPEIIEDWVAGREVNANVELFCFPEEGIPLPRFLRKIFSGRELGVDLRSRSSEAWREVGSLEVHLCQVGRFGRGG